GVLHGVEGVAHLLEFGGGVVEGHHPRTALGRFEGVAAEPAAEVQQAVAGAQAEAFVADRQHRPAGSATAGRRASTSRYWSTASSASAYSSTMRSSVTSDTNDTTSPRPSDSMRSADFPDLGLPMMVSDTSRSVRSLATASNR